MVKQRTSNPLDVSSNLTTCAINNKNVNKRSINDR